MLLVNKYLNIEINKFKIKTKKTLLEIYVFYLYIQNKIQKYTLENAIN